MSILIKTFERNPIATICLFTAIMLLPHLSTLQVSIMEARNFVTAREMVTDGNWLLTTMNGEPRYEKPPLPTWLTAISSLVFGGKNLFGLRLPAVLLVMVIGCFVYLLSKVMLKNPLHSLTNALIVITSFYIFGIIIEAPWDIFAHGFMLVAIYHLFLLFKSNRQAWKNALTASLFIGFSFMSKGPVSLYALLLPFLIAYGFTYKYNDLKGKSAPLLVSIALAILFSVWWYLYVRIQDTETFIAIAQKETGNWTSYNVRPFYYYWSFFIQSGLWSIPAFIGLLYPYLKKRVVNLKAYRFSLLWTLLAVVLLSLIPEKKSRYLMPVLIPLSINTGFYIEYLFREFKELHNKKETVPVFFNFGFVATVGILFPLVGYFLLKNYLPGNWGYYLAASVVLPLTGISLMMQLKKRRMKQVFFLTVLTFGLLLTASALIFSKSFTNPGIDPFASLKTLATQRDLKVYGYDSVPPETIWHFGGKIPIINSDSSQLIFPDDETFILIAPLENKLKEDLFIIAQYNAEELGTLDLNLIQPEFRDFNPRKASKYYLLNRKK
ncbi:MAG TPA: phospholipid carrier-dependent glycosyltransferase [Dysgonamonadaceae bacterium]|nr:phospholipid carrier-dependent glycosyltransferase [Dysgonamonadaceae bacterium]